MQVYKWHHTASWEFLVSSAPRKSPRGMVFFVATARRSMRADSGSFAKALCQDSCQYVNYCLRALSCAFTKSLAVRPPLPPRRCSFVFNFSQLRQNHCQYVNYCLRSFPCLCATPLAVRLFARTSSSLCRTSYPFIALLLYRLRALSCAFTKSLAVHLSSHASPLLRSYFFTTAPELLPICKLLPAVFSLPLRKFPRCPPLCSHLVAAPIVFFHHCDRTIAERRVRRARG